MQASVEISTKLVVQIQNVLEILSSARGVFDKKRGMLIERKSDCVCNPPGHAAIEHLILSDRFQQRRGCTRPPSRRLHSPRNRGHGVML